MSTEPSDKQIAQPQEVFISYSRKDKDFVGHLNDALKSRGRKAWVDWEDIRPTEEFMQTIYAAIEGADTFIFVLTPDSVASVACGREIAHAAANNKRMVPIVVRDVKANTVPEALAKLQWIFYCRDGDDFEKATDTLISALDTDLKWVQAHTRLLTRAIEWEANGRNNSFVLRGDDLRSAERWLAEAGTQKERQPTALQTEYIIASRKAAARRERIMLGTVTFGFMVAIVLAVVAWKQRTEAVKNANETDRQKHEAIKQEAKAKDQTKKTSEAASRGNVLLARYSKESGKNAEALAQLAQALRLNPENREASGLTAAMLIQLSWHVPLTGSMKHESAVTSAQFTPDGQRVVTASADKTVRMWDAATGQQIGEPMKHGDSVSSAQFSPDGQRVVTASDDKTAKLWDAATGKQIGEPLKHEDGISSAQFSPDSQQVVTGSWDKTARLWDAATGQQIGEPMKHEGVVTSAQFSPDGQRVVTASLDNTARLWDALSGKPIGEPMKHDDDVSSAQFSPDGQRVVTASVDKTVRLWDAATGKSVGEPLKHQGAVSSARFSPSSQQVATVSGDTVRVWDSAIATGEGTREDILLLAELAEATGGVTLETVEQAENFKLLTPEQVRVSREKVAAKLSKQRSKFTPIQRLMLWSVSDRRTRTISPFSQLTVSEWLENRIKEGTVEGLRAAMQVDAANARLTAHLGRRLADHALKPGGDPDEARRARGEADFLTSRALKLAPDNNEVKKLREDVVKLLDLKM
jgi:WD40 repeat protein